MVAFTNLLVVYIKAIQQEANITKITDVPHPAIKIMVIIASVKKEYFDARGHQILSSLR